VRRRGAREIAAVYQGNAQAAHRGVARDRGAIDTGANYREIEFLIAKSRQTILTVQRHHQ
jgi:hypothetical protein